MTLAGGFSLTRSLAAVGRPVLTDSPRLRRGRRARGPGRRSVHYIDQVDTPNPVVVRDWTGARAPLHAVSSGQVLLAFRTQGAIERYLSQPSLERFTDETLTDPEVVRERLREVRRHGHAWAIEEFDAGISSVAAPIADAFGRGDRRGPPARTVIPLPPAGQEAALAQLVVSGAARIAASLREG